MKQIFDQELPQYGITTNHTVMDNGELRFRLAGRDGSCYIRTEAAADSGWQNSHWHKALQELCLVQQGTVVYAELQNGRAVKRTYAAGESFIVPPMMPHNAWMSPGAILHTIKFGDCSAPDWNPSPELDKLLKERG